MIDSTDISRSKDSYGDCVFAVDLGGTHLRAANVSGDGRIHFRHKQATPHTGNAKEIVNAIVRAAKECEAQAKQEMGTGQTLRAISVVVPGTVNVETGVVVKAPNVSALDGFSLAAALTEELNLPALVENDANAAAVGEMWQGAGREARRSFV